MGRKKRTNKEFIQEVYNLVKDEYEFLENYNGAQEKIKCKHNKCLHIWLANPNKFLLGTRCPNCSVKGVGRKTNQQFLHQVHELVGDEYIFLENYINAKTKLKCKHNIEECGFEWNVLPIKFLTQTKCPKCFGNFKKTNEEFKSEVFSMVGDEYLFLEKYKNAKTKLRCKHNIDECEFEWFITPNDFLCGKRCPRCSSSKGEIKIANWLISNDIKYIQEYKFIDCKLINPLPFDFYLPTFNLLIEYDGEHHFKPVRFGGISKMQAEILLYETKKRDSIKSEYSKINNITLLRIPYTNYDNIEQILSSKLEELNEFKSKIQSSLIKVV